MDFARLLRSVIPDKHFVGRYGGDEFMAVIYHTSKTEIEELLQSLSREKTDGIITKIKSRSTTHADGQSQRMKEPARCRCYWIRQIPICMKINNYARNVI